MKSWSVLALLAVSAVCLVNAQDIPSVAPVAIPNAVVGSTVAPLLPVTLPLDDGTEVTFTPDACIAAELSSSLSPIEKLKERVEHSFVELPGVGGACGSGGRCVALKANCAAGSAIVWSQCAAGVAKCCVPTKSAAKPATPTPAAVVPSTPAASVASGKIVSGPDWVQKYLGSKSLDDLSSSYGPKAKAFINALRAAGATVTIAATYRPMERSYMMYNAWRVALGTVAPTAVPSYPGVNIDWSHGGNRAAAKAAAQRMCSSYGINWRSAKQKVAPAGSSRHNYRAAVDMNIQGYVGKLIANPKGAKVKVSTFSQLVALGGQYGVRYFSGENMHWSDTGH